jgi:hypothetical protein
MADKANEYIENYADHGDAIPSAVGMAVYLNVAKSTLYKWADDNHFDFSDTLEFCNDAQHVRLMNQGLTGEFNATITKLALSNHGYSEKTQTDVTSGGEPIKNEWHIHPTTSKAE